MIEKIDHIGIAVENLEAAVETYRRLYGLEPVKIETMAAIGVRIAFIPVGQVLIELLQPTEPGVGRIGQFLRENGEGFHHIAFRVQNIDRELERLTEMDVGLRDKEPRSGGDHSRIAFLNQSFTHDLLTELVERKTELGKEER